MCEQQQEARQPQTSPEEPPEQIPFPREAEQEKPPMDPHKMILKMLHSELENATEAVKRLQTAIDFFEDHPDAGRVLIEIAPYMATRARGVMPGLFL